MILTTTLNPSVDIGYRLDMLALDQVNRVEHVSKTAGGKGINVARVLRQLDEKVAATGYLGGELGDFIRKQLADAQIADAFVDVSGETRNCIAVMHEGKQTEILEGGPTIKAEEADKFLTAYEQALEKSNYVTVSGSLPKGLQSDFYVHVVKRANEQKVPVLLDTSGESLSAVLESDHKPFFIKPNEDELQSLVEDTIKTEKDIQAVLNNELFAGIDWIVVTLGADGALVKHQDTYYRLSIPTVEAVNPVGSGDSVVAGFAAAFNKKLNISETMKYGMTMGVLNAMEAQTGYINPGKITEIMQQITVEKL